MVAKGSLGGRVDDFERRRAERLDPGATDVEAQQVVHGPCYCKLWRGRTGEQHSGSNSEGQGRDRRPVACFGWASTPVAPIPTPCCLQDGRRVVASAKALTTHWDLSVGHSRGDPRRAGSAPARDGSRRRAAGVGVDDAGDQRRRRGPLQPRGHGADRLRRSHGGTLRACIATRPGPYSRSAAGTMPPARSSSRSTSAASSRAVQRVRRAGRRFCGRGLLLGAQSRARIARPRADPRAAATSRSPVRTSSVRAWTRRGAP